MELKIEKKNGFVNVRLSRPDVHNAFNAPLISQLTEAFSDLSNDSSTRVIVLSGEGKNFCAGADLNWMRSTIDLSAKENEADSARLHLMLETIYGCTKPVIVEIQGIAFGGGVGLIAASDIGIAADNSVLCMSEVRLGIMPAVISPFVIRKMGLGNFRAYGLSARRLSAADALRIGLIHEVVPPDRLDEAVQGWVDLLQESGPHAMAELKQLSEEVYGARSFSEASATTVKANAKARTGPEGQEGMRAFLEKRVPTWRSH